MAQDIQQENKSSHNDKDTKELYQLLDILFSLDLTESDVPKSVLLKVALHYQNLSNMLKKLIDGESESIIAEQVDLHFDYQAQYDFIKSVESKSMVVDALEYLDEELQKLNQVLHDPSYFGEIIEYPTTDQEIEWSKKIYNAVMNS